MWLDDLRAAAGLEEERSNTGSNQQLKSSPRIKECVLRSGKSEKSDQKRQYHQNLEHRRWPT